MIDVLDLTLYGEVTLYDFTVAFFVMFFAVLIARFATSNLRRALSEKLKKDQLEILLKVVNLAILLVAFLSISPMLGINLSGLLVAGGITGIVIGFASQSVVANLISGLFLLWEKPIKLGDQINVDGIAGFVEDINIISTVVRTYDGLYVRIPNEKLFTSKITNYVANVARRFEYTIGIRYSDDADRAVEIVKRVVEDEPFVLKNPAPVVFVDSLGDSAVNLVVKVWAPVSVWYDVKMALLNRIKVELERNGIEIPFPQRVVWFASDLRLRKSGE
ncbi:mechanosensitive ion channel family protein [Geoglobus sp.]